MRLLMVEDDTLFGAAMHKALLRGGYAADWLQSAQGLRPALQAARYDCVLLDLMLPDAPGESCLATVREAQPGVPVIVVTARGGVTDRIALLDRGADDYLVKPVDLDELTARVRAVTRRAQAQPGGPTTLEHGALVLVPERRTASWKGADVTLTNKEFWLLETLLRKKGQIHTRTSLEDALYGWGESVDSNTVEVYVHHLRRKFNYGLIRTIRGVGYQLGEEEPVDA